MRSHRTRVRFRGRICGVGTTEGTRVVVDRDEPSAVIGTFLTCANGGQQPGTITTGFGHRR